jgi:peroxiredoxin
MGTTNLEARPLELSAGLGRGSHFIRIGSEKSTALPRSCHDAAMSTNYTTLPPNLPVPEDDGAADHLPGTSLAPLALSSSDGGSADLARLAAGRLVAYVYPRTGMPGEPSPVGWDDIPGARGCTPQSCAYRDSLADFERLGATVVGISAQSNSEQREFAEREHIPFQLLSDGDLGLASALGLPTFTADGTTLYRRLTFVAEAGTIVKAFYPVFPPDRDAAEVLSWLADRPAPKG